MKKLEKYLLNFIIVLVIIFGIKQFSPIYCTDEIFKESISRFDFYIGILLIIFASVSFYFLINKVFTTLISFIIVVIFIFTLLLSISMMLPSLCSETTKRTLFLNRMNSDWSIVERGFGCGATDSSPDRLSTAKQFCIFSSFYWITTTDTTNLNQNVWERVPN